MTRLPQRRLFQIEVYNNLNHTIWACNNSFLRKSLGQHPKPECFQIKYKYLKSSFHAYIHCQFYDKTSTARFGRGGDVVWKRSLLMRARCPGRRGKAQSPSQAGVCYLQPYKVLQTQTLKLAKPNFNSKHCLSPGGRVKVGQPRSQDGDEDYQRIPLSKAM